MRSVKRVALRVNPRDEEGRRIFVNIGQTILRAKSEADVLTLFQVLCGEEKLSAAALLGHFYALWEPHQGV